MSTVRCPFCHEQIESSAYAAHEANHTKQLPDGQMTDHISLPEEEREAGDLEGVPRVYLHRKCGVATQMPEEIIRSYLKNPYLYSDQTFCCGCGTYVNSSEFIWTETGENCKTYKDKLKAAKPEMKPKGCAGAVLLFAAGLSALAVRALV